jgi:hypothetical protein
MRDSKKYPDDMVENLAESPGMCLDGPGSAPIEIPKRETFSLRGSKKERKKVTWVGLGKEKECLLVFIPRPGSHTHAARADGPRRPRGQSARRADGPLLLPERPVPHLFPTSHADGPRRPGGHSSRSGRTVRPIAADGPTSPFKFSLI